MLAHQIVYVILLTLSVIKHTTAPTISYKVPDFDVKNYDLKAHLANPNVSLVCRLKDNICRSNYTNLCAMRITNGTRIYKDYTNSCYLYMGNMCDNPSDVFHILMSGTCSSYLASRRQEDENENGITKSMVHATVDSVSENANTATTADATAVDYTEAPILRQKTALTTPTMYSIKRSYDYHICPKSCPNIYSPECMNVNLGKARFHKFFEFVNHCYSDMYYCSHHEEFVPIPAGHDNQLIPPVINMSPLEMTFCADIRYLDFYAISRIVSTVGHYGWLQGDFSGKHIMKPEERVPGYG